MDFEHPQTIIANFGLGKNGDVHKFFTNTCALHMDKYVPYDEGTLANSVVQGGVVTSNVDVDSITYDQEYASYVYNGISKNGNSLNYSHDMHPYAGDHWDERMVSAEMSEIEQEVQDYIDRRYYR